MPRKDSVEIGILSDSAFYILSSVIKEKHGWLIMKTIEELTYNKVVIGPASLYTTLKKLLEAGLLERISTEDENKKVYKITEIGHEMLLKDIERKKQMVEFAERLLN